MTGFRSISRVLIAVLVAALVSSCGKKGSESARTLGFDEFVPVYNSYIRKWLGEQKEASEKDAAKLRGEIAAAADAEAKEKLSRRLRQMEKDMEKWDFRLGLGDYLRFGKPSEIPADLVWENGMDQPEIGDPRAKKGGVYRKFIETFPPTLRPFGENANNSFRSDLYDNVEMGLVGLHPATMKLIPALAREWALSSDKRTVYFRLDPAATYSDGEPVRARDFLISIYLRVSDNIMNPFEKQYFREQIAQVCLYDDETLSVTLPSVRVYAPWTASLSPAAPRFYAGYGPDYKDRYQWKFQPTTGAYEVLPGDINKGVSITQTRVKNWWAKDRKFYRYRYNPDKLVSTVVRDESKAFELFRAGELDDFFLTRPEYWYEKSEIPPVFDGYIERVTFYNRYPKVPRGLYLNTNSGLLKERNVRIGIQHAMNWQKVIEVLFRGDYQRLNSFYDGFAVFSDPSIKARPYSIESAREAFRQAGFTEEDKDGILKRPDGTRLSVSVTYPAIPAVERMFAILREEAKACGFELRLDGLEATVCYRKEMQKQHEMSLGSWLVTPPIPDFYQFLHSSNAFDDKCNPKPQTNNTFVWGRADTDALCERAHDAATEEELRDACWKLQRIVHDEAMFVPAYSVDFVRLGFWRWVKWPDCENSHFCSPVVYDPHDTFEFWIDQQVKEETLKARREGRKFPESTKTYDDYRAVAPAAQGEEARHE